MKFKTNLFFACFIFLSFSVFAQLSQDTRQNLPTAEQYKKIKKYDSTITLDSQEKIKGILYKVTDESIILLPKDKHIKQYSHFVKLVKEDQRVLKISSIHKMKTRKGNAGKGFLLGFGIGAFLGLPILSANSGYEFAAIGVGGIGGGLIGLIVGSITQKSHSPKNKRKMEQLRKKGIAYGY